MHAVVSDIRSATGWKKQMECSLSVDDVTIWRRVEFLTDRPAIGSTHLPSNVNRSFNLSPRSRERRCNNRPESGPPGGAICKSLALDIHNSGRHNLNHSSRCDLGEAGAHCDGSRQGTSGPNEPSRRFLRASMKTKMLRTFGRRRALVAYQ
jgi:hypothetical protein